MVLAYDFPMLGVFWTILEVALFVIWIWLLLAVFGDLFRSADLSGVAKALWVVVLLVMPYLGVIIYLVVRGGSMHERAWEHYARRQQLFANAAGGAPREPVGTDGPGAAVVEPPRI